MLQKTNNLSPVLVGSTDFHPWETITRCPQHPAKMVSEKVRGEPGLLSLFQLLAHLCPHAASGQRDTQGVGGTGLLFSTRACVCAKSPGRA